MRIAIAADHNGVEVKRVLIADLTAGGHAVEDLGAHGHDTVDYPPLCEILARRVLGDGATHGVMIGGTGSGEQMVLNKIPGIRAALGHDVLTTEISRAHNDANVLVMGAKVLDAATARDHLELWLDTPFKGGRHRQRLDQMAALERGESLL